MSADRDLQVCKVFEPLLPDDTAKYACAFHIQQAIEKLLMSIILLHGEQPEFTHNIFKLAKKCETFGIELPKDFDMLADSLTLWGTTSRYDSYIAFSQSKYELAKEAYEKYNSIYEQKQQ